MKLSCADWERSTKKLSADVNADPSSVSSAGSNLIRYFLTVH